MLESSVLLFLSLKHFDSQAMLLDILVPYLQQLYNCDFAISILVTESGATWLTRHISQIKEKNLKKLLHLVGKS